VGPITHTLDKTDAFQVPAACFAHRVLRPECGLVCGPQQGLSGGRASMHNLRSFIGL
jgi:hypothetical protein